LENMLKRVWCCIHSKMKSWSWTICCLISYSNGGRDAWVGGGKRSHVTLRHCWKRNVLLSIHVKVSRRKGCWLIINLTIMIKMTRVQLLK
jgi:hypothetical protein